MVRYVDADARMLRAAAHPTRGAIIYELAARGESTATEIAAAIGEPVNSVSFHLRQLAKYDLVEEAANASGDRRQRWWRVPHDGFLIDRERISQEPGGDAVMSMRRRHALAWWRELLARYFLRDHPGGEVWRINEMPMRLTDDEAEEMAEEVLAVLQKWAKRGQRRNRATGPEGRRTYLGFSVVLPHQPDLARDSAEAERAEQDESLGGTA